MEADEIQSNAPQQITVPINTSPPNDNDADGRTYLENDDFFALSLLPTEREDTIYKPSPLSKVKDPNTGQLMPGCDHYPRNCMLKAACCEDWVVCRQCHDDVKDHRMPRHRTTVVMCLLCGCVQRAAKTCSTCQRDFADYFCDICKFYDNTPGKEIYHCYRCGICRLGPGIDRGNFHCDRCNACISKDFEGTHRCLRKSLDTNCPSCGEYLRTSTKLVRFMTCGHAMHYDCFEAANRTENFRCPSCRETLETTPSIDTLMMD